MKNETYIYSKRHSLVRLFGGGARGSFRSDVFATIAGMVDAGNTQISNDYLCGLFDTTERALRPVLEYLYINGYITRSTDRHRGCATIYGITEQGASVIQSKKGYKNVTLLKAERVTNFAQKGLQKCSPNNINNTINNKEKIIKKENSQIMAKFKKPTLAELQEYCTARANGIDAQAFLDYYESKGWLIGKSPMKDWRAAVRTWERREKENNQKQVRYGRANYTPADAARAIELGIALADAERANI